MFHDTFTRWGLPLAIRVDDGHPWGAAHDLPPALALWLIGLGVHVHWNPAGCPRCNAKVERTNGVTQDWVEPHVQADRDELEVSLAHATRVQREHYESIRGRTRLEAFPALISNPRRYDREMEATLWQLSRVDEFFGERIWRRKADRIGRIWIYNRGKLLGKAWAGQTVFVHFDPRDRRWVVEDTGGKEIKRFPALELNRERIVGLEVGHRRKPRQRPESSG